MEETAKKLLRTALNNPSAKFRSSQWDCIKALLSKRRMLVVQRTGWGKSMVYFLVTRMLRDAGYGLTLLISPLLSLMRNQIQAAERIGIRAETINSTNPDEWMTVQEKLLRNEVDILLISPERLANDQFREDILIPVAERIGLFVVDEAHCISDWGHDFRPDYRRIMRILQALPKNIPVLATTATANNRVVNDVAAQLGDLQIERGPLTRRSLKLQNIELPSQASRLAWLAENLPRMKGSGIVYTLTKRDAEGVAEWLRQNGIDARAYHADVVDREALEELLLGNQIKALVATVALGMGFDKPDLGFVVHYQRPASVVHYYQQVGRAGRAVDEAYGILLSGHEDEDITDYFIRTAFPPQSNVESVLKALKQSEDGLSVPMIESELNLSRGQIAKTLKYLSVESPSPIIKEGSHWYALPVDYQPDREIIEKLCTLRRAEQEEMRRYMKTGECLMQFLSCALDDPLAEPCGRCAGCYCSPLLSEEIDTELAKTAGIFLKNSHQPIHPRKMWVSGAFPKYGYKGRISPKQMAEQGRALSMWGDVGWGHMVRDGKYRDQRFHDDLIEGCQKMLDVWSLSPKPTWMTSVPSLTHPNLVPDFGKRLAEKLAIPFVPVVKKALQNRPQKEMQNSYQQAHNLDGAFLVDRHPMPEGAVLLIDDLVDSRWTFTVVAALLRDAGCPAVFPLALAMSSPGSI